MHFYSYFFSSSSTEKPFFIQLSFPCRSLLCTVALVGKFKKWSQISAPLLKTCIFDGRSSTKNLDSKFGPWLYRRAHHYERRFAPRIAVHDGICAPKMVHETLINGDWRRGSPFSSKSSRNVQAPLAPRESLQLISSFGVLVFVPKPII